MIVLFTDFQTSDGIGLVKGVIKSIHKEAEILDYHHFVAPFQVRSGAWILHQGYKFFPEGTIFYAVVDPGVGGKRRAIVVKTKNYYFVAPDNGLVYPAAVEDGIESVVELATKGSSATFEGRDVFAPAAARLEAGEDMESLGPVIKNIAKIEVDADHVEGEIMIIEPYGNIVTNIPKTGNKTTYKVVCGKFEKNLKFYRTFSSAKKGELFVLEGSRKTYEISVREGSAQDITGCKVGDKIGIQ